MSVKRKAKFLFLAIMATVGSSCSHSRDVLNPGTPRLTLVLRHVALADGKLVTPEVTFVSLVRFYGRLQRHVQETPVDTKVLALAVVENGRVVLPFYRPSPESDPSLFRYHIGITQCMSDALESVVYTLEPHQLRGEASFDGRTEHSISDEGVVKVDVPYGNSKWEIGLNDQERLLSRIGRTTDLMEKESHLLPAPSRRLLARWALDRLEELKTVGVGKHQALWSRCKLFWASVE